PRPRRVPRGRCRAARLPRPGGAARCAGGAAVSWPALQALLDDHRVSELMVNGPGRVWVEREGTLVATDVVLDERELDAFVERLLAASGRRVDRRTPYADARLADGSRVNVIIPPAAVDGACVTIRRFASAPRAIDAFTGPGPARVLRWAVEARLNVL